MSFKHIWFSGSPRDPGETETENGIMEAKYKKRFGGDCTPQSSFDKVSQDP